MQELNIADAAKSLGVSTDTIRRRISKGELKARKVESPHGEMYLVEIPEQITPDNVLQHTAPANNDAEVEALKQTISILQGELEARRREISELHILLQRASLPAPKPVGIPWWKRIFVRSNKKNKA